MFMSAGTVPNWRTAYCYSSVAVVVVGVLITPADGCVFVLSAFFFSVKLVYW